MEAQYRSKCAVCGEWIEPGDEVVPDEDENWIHQDCADDDD
jgi:predicted nucleic acid-binding Zn ribbon protein